MKKTDKPAYAFGSRAAQYLKQSAIAGEVPAGSYAARPEPKIDLAKEIIDEDMRAPAPASPAPAPKSPAGRIFGDSPQEFLSGITGGAKKVMGGLNNARLAAGNAIGETLGTMYAAGPEAWAGGHDNPATPAPAPAINKTTSSGNVPWGTIGAAGLGGAGLLGLYYLMQQRKKKREAEEAAALKMARVYEAAESVEGMKPKEVYESHKKCTPGEFGMNKAGGAKQSAAEFGRLIGQTM